ncbi:MAG: 50S ribosomal protein L32 [Aerococcus sp.]|nr:50S ribosomal protein L32 [Aerococcus sp.]
MAVPKRKTSKQRKRLRRTHVKLTVPGMNPCPNCGELRKSHHVCSNCGYYDGRNVMEEVEETEEA